MGGEIGYQKIEDLDPGYSNQVAGEKWAAIQQVKRKEHRSEANEKIAQIAGGAFLLAAGAGITTGLVVTLAIVAPAGVVGILFLAGFPFIVAFLAPGVALTTFGLSDFEKVYLYDPKKARRVCVMIRENQLDELIHNLGKKSLESLSENGIIQDTNAYNFFHARLLSMLLVKRELHFEKDSRMIDQKKRRILEINQAWNDYKEKNLIEALPF